MYDLKSNLIPIDRRRALDAIAKRVTRNLDLLSRRRKELLDSEVESDQRNVTDFDGFEEATHLLFRRFVVGFLVELLRQEWREGVGRRIILRLENRGRFEDDRKVEVVSGAEGGLPSFVLRVDLKQNTQIFEKSFYS
jgi:hypothetical protein